MIIEYPVHTRTDEVTVLIIEYPVHTRACGVYRYMGVCVRVCTGYSLLKTVNVR